MGLQSEIMLFCPKHLGTAGGGEEMGAAEAWWGQAAGEIWAKRGLR